ncbi:hypothetical protein P12x_000787 [Tundrisphaera lichenicola]|uniref:hypothetical protein n=1 Tax=Tundrisphaera lichenicola TaxID=2029860 RepID=UPI003EB83A67
MPSPTEFTPNFSSGSHSGRGESLLRRCFFLLALTFLATSSRAEEPVPSSAGLPPSTSEPGRSPGDWLIDGSSAVAKVHRGGSDREIFLENGLVRRTFRLAPNGSTVGLDHLGTGESFLRSVLPEAILELDGKKVEVGGLVGAKIHNFLEPEALDALDADPGAWRCVGFQVGRTEARFPWLPHREWIGRDLPWPPPGVRLSFTYRPTDPAVHQGVSILVHYELYDGLPLFAKWLTMQNNSKVPVTVDRLVVEQLAVVEPESLVGAKPVEFRQLWRNLDVFSDYAFGGGMTGQVDSPAVHWKSDPAYETQTHYLKETPCLLECSPIVGPDAEIEPGETFESFRVFELLHDGSDRERRGLALRRSYRALAPWVLENPILMHVRSAQPDAIRLAIDQCAEVGFEMVIMTFGSGLNMEDDSPETLARIKQVADYAHSKGIALGGYSLLASRSINPTEDAINPATGKPGGMIFENSPCLCSRWGRDYFARIRHFFEATGCDVLEHDGSYPGDICASTKHPGHKGRADSQWKQWEAIRDLYHWSRARGIYLNVPDWYFLAGSNKIAMGYRETNWSLPRHQQEIIERQNIYDGTWEKAPSMGWMFVPLSEYHGGGAAATIEPLAEHLDHYETRLANLFGAGVQACYRGARLYDTDATKAVVKRWVDFYKAHRAILDSDLIHLRRPDGRDWDGWLHVNPELKERGLAMIYNPLPQEIDRTIKVPLYYAGLTGRVQVREQEDLPRTIALDPRTDTAEVQVKIPARQRTWIVFEPATD